MFLKNVYPLLIFPAIYLLMQQTDGLLVVVSEIYLTIFAQILPFTPYFLVMQEVFSFGVFYVPIDLVFLFHKHRPWRKLVFKILSLFLFWPFFIINTWVQHESGSLCLHKFISPEYFSCLRFFQLIYIFQWYIPFEMQGMFVEYLVTDASQNMSFQELFLTVLYLFAQDPNEIGRCSPRSTCLQRLVGDLVNLFFVHSVFCFIWETEHLNGIMHASFIYHVIFQISTIFAKQL